VKRFISLLLSLCVPFSIFSIALEEMTLDQKIGQLFVVPACPLRGEDHWNDWLNILRDCHVGNAIVKQSDPISQLKFLNRIQNESKIPLLIAADAEWGLAMRMSDTIAYPRNMTLGAIKDPRWIYQMALEIGRQAKRVGIHINLAPVADVNNNPLNPVIHMRSFGDDPERVADCVAAYLKGLSAGGVLAAVKHFPGHGDTTVDSHRDLPVISNTLQRLESLEFVPFKRAVQEGVELLMTAHLFIPAIDAILPASLSPSCIRIARDQLHFDGLMISDALNMKAIADCFSPEEIAILARKAGCDFLLYGAHKAPMIDQILREQVPRAFSALKAAYLSGELDGAELDRSVLRILRAKEKIKTQFPLDDLIEELNTQESLILKKNLYQEAITLIGDPVFSVTEQSTYLSFGTGDVLAPYFRSESDDRVILAIHQKEAIDEKVLSLIEYYGDRAIVCLFATPYALKALKAAKTILVGYENDPDAQRALLNVLLGKCKPKGHLPVTVDDL
jgi:beta-N-acetylhexosaminidase